MTKKQENMHEEDIKDEQITNKTSVDKDEVLEEFDSLETELKESKDKFLRLFAEFDNFKKRTAKERMEFRYTASMDTLQAFLPVLDDFDRAKKVADDDSTDEVFTEGVNLVYQKLKSIMETKGIKEMKSTGELFDPELYEAITEIPAPNEDMKGRVIDTVEKGYYLNDKIIRHAKVVVGK